MPYNDNNNDPSKPRPLRFVVPDVVSATLTSSTTNTQSNNANPSTAFSIGGSEEQEDTGMVSSQQGSSFNGSDKNSNGILDGIRKRAMNFAASAVGNAMKGMYKDLGTAGFNPGEEFITAIKEGQKYNADIILGDQDVEITLTKLTQALLKSDLNKLTDPSFEQSMNELLLGSSSKSIVVPPLLKDYENSNVEQYKQDLTSYVELLKSRTNVRTIMYQLNLVAPELVRAMLTERDSYMATGIDLLNQYECIVAVMGIAHLDGVEQNLQQKGWYQVPLSKACSAL